MALFLAKGVHSWTGLESVQMCVLGGAGNHVYARFLGCGIGYAILCNIIEIFLFLLYNVFSLVLHSYLGCGCHTVILMSMILDG